ncbi:glycosyl hydrolase family 85 protein-like protein [Dendryphion nanum]|uniref:Glycosyl hydrolase family 85 protein-like protein n=1 Tax=Dendryphion nanum TaxID=256645 RepID=A0A9P9DEI3_9PLEO|nr:glycosyl hydrolase family 85 protein-like protein [Dendryphion nanum]
MATLFGWKDILRPIRDGYRHLFPSPDTGPTPEERERQRQLDRLKGFTYFDTFEQLEHWSESDSAGIQRANTPIIQRSVVTESATENSRVLLCHDYAGNYQDYESIQGIGDDEEKFYSCEYLHFVDTFIYFSHKLVCTPPPSWTNSLHRNGVRSLGTFLIEPQTKDMSRMLQMDGNGLFPIARKLATVAENIGFDGWLINIEKPFPKEDWDYKKLEGFLQQLKNDLGPPKTLIWYDAITWINSVDYQNALTPQNLTFSKACGSVLTNYSWDEENALSSRQFAIKNGILPQNLYFGVDVWAQSTSSRTHPRVTFPKQGGGGTNTGLAVEKLAELGISSGIFAPAWSFEHFPGHGKDIERTIWEGTEPPAGLQCACGDTHRRHPVSISPVENHAMKYTVGSESFFFTDFSRAFGHHGRQERDCIYEGKALHSQLGSQSILPNCPMRSPHTMIGEKTNILSYRLHDLAGHTQLVVEFQAPSSVDHAKEVTHEQRLPLFKLNIPAHAPLHLRTSIQYTIRQPGMTVSLYLSFDHHIEYMHLQADDAVRLIETTIFHPPSHGKLKEFGVHLRAQNLQLPVQIMSMLDLCITNDADLPEPGSQAIHSIQLTTQGTGETKHTRLYWEYSAKNPVETMLSTPHSGLTGPFSHFCINVGEVLLGKAYALEYVLRQSIVESLLSDDGTEVAITGIGFDGRVIATEKALLHR